MLPLLLYPFVKDVYFRSGLKTDTCILQYLKVAGGDYQPRRKILFSIRLFSDIQDNLHSIWFYYFQMKNPRRRFLIELQNLLVIFILVIDFFV